MYIHCVELYYYYYDDNYYDHNYHDTDLGGTVGLGVMGELVMIGSNWNGLCSTSRLVCVELWMNLSLSLKEWYCCCRPNIRLWALQMGGGVHL